MRAVIQDRYGTPEDALHVVDDLERPTAKEDEVLVFDERDRRSSEVRGVRPEDRQRCHPRYSLNMFG
jgi:hypothetical protein